jgi:multidrug efflux pump subunit AcrB
MLFLVVPKSFLPVGDSGFRLRPRSSPRKAVSPRTDAPLSGCSAQQVIQADPDIEMAGVVTGVTGFIASNQGVIFAFLKDPSQRPPITRSPSA